MSTAEIIRPPLLDSGQRLERDEFYRRVDEWEQPGRNPRGIERLEGDRSIAQLARLIQDTMPEDVPGR